MRKQNKILFAILIILLVIILIVNITPHTKTLETPKENVSLAVTGDVMFARNMPNVLSLDSSPFAGVSNVTSNVDMLLINFENAATESGDALKGDVPLKCSPIYVPLAKANNVTVASLANNHALDYGITGMNDTIHYLKDAGITPIGAGNSEDEAHQCVTKEINGRKITILNYMDADNFAEYSYDVMPYANASNPGYSAYDLSDAQRQIAENNDSDLIIAYMHFGNEYSTSPNENQVKIAHELIDNGVDVVIGSHPHVVQGIEMYNGKAIFYSLGNFVFDQSNTATHQAYMLKIELINDTCVCSVYPIYISNYLPYFMDADSGKSLLNSLSPHSDELEVSDDGVGKLDFNLTE